ncbi:MAG: shikimate dehydrogenase [Anaerotignum sp.]|nr:shikimate dehydrogenase [Anaerotignum sp.]
MRYGLIGEKLGHSFSKIIHEQLADYTYDLIPLTKEELDIFMTEKQFSALNVTIPYKETVIPYLDEVNAHAMKIGAVNTIVNRDGKLTGYNTDFYGFRYMLQHNGIDVQNKKALVLGKGGASKAVIAVLEELGVKEILTVYYKENPETITYEECYQNHTDAEIIVNTTPVGMYPKADDCPIDLDKFPNLSGVADVVYNPLRTQLIIEAEKRGINAAGGLEMLVAQAKYAAEIFLDTKIEDNRIDEIHAGLVKERSNLVLIGMSGGGKTSLGRKAAKKLGKAFVDTDEEIVKRIGMPIADFFAQEGEAAFREIETEVLHEFSAQNNLVISIHVPAFIFPWL